MGLDSYIIKRTYADSYAEKLYYTAQEIAYWRKAWPIHSWFVKNVQDGVDNCADYYIPIKKLEELLNIVNSILSSDNREEEAYRLLPPNGFIDDYYFNHLETAKEVIEKILSDEENIEPFSVSYYYTASW